MRAENCFGDILEFVIFLLKMFLSVSTYCGIYVLHSYSLHTLVMSVNYNDKPVEDTHLPTFQIY